MCVIVSNCFGLPRDSHFKHVKTSSGGKKGLVRLVPGLFWVVVFWVTVKNWNESFTSIGSNSPHCKYFSLEHCMINFGSGFTKDLHLGLGSTLLRSNRSSQCSDLLGEVEMRLWSSCSRYLVILWWICPKSLADLIMSKSFSWSMRPLICLWINPFTTKNADLSHMMDSSMHFPFLFFLHLPNLSDLFVLNCCIWKERKWILDASNGDSLVRCFSLSNSSLCHRCDALRLVGDFSCRWIWLEIFC
jgi:hypothetical protein